jgi:hypothetical protein
LMTGSRSKDLTIRIATTGMITYIESSALASCPGRSEQTNQVV